MIGDIIDENELISGVRQEGLFYSARAFFAKASNSVGHFFAGIMLEYYVRLPQQAIPGELDADIIMRLGITAGPIMGVAAIISLLITASTISIASVINKSCGNCANAERYASPRSRFRCGILLTGLGGSHG